MHLQSKTGIPVLSLHSVMKQFGKVTAVNNLSFSINKGEIFALLGPNGAGKTTTVRMIMQIFDPDSGSISFDASLKHNGKVNRQRLGYLPEDRGLYQDAALIDTLVYLATLRGCEPKPIKRKAEEWLERFDLVGRKNDKISTLSKGNQQKVQFLASILHKPEFAILDEPFSGFDPINQEMIIECIRELREEGMTILLSAHQLQLVEKVSDRILLMNEGKDLISGSLDEIRQKTVSDQKLIVEYLGDVNAALFKSSSNIKSILNTGNGSWEVYMNDGTSINDVISTLAMAGSIKQLKTSEVSLHEIFIESFKNGVS